MTFTRVSRELRISRDTARLLSQATYHQLVLALRELVANAHDGNAAHIRLSLGFKEKQGGDIKVVDDGDGMSTEEFDNEFLNLGQTSKWSPALTEIRRNRFGRPILGRFGIGFISAIPFAKEVLVETKRREDDSVSGVRIDCGAIINASGPGEENSFTFPGWSRSPTADDQDKFTRVEMLGLNRQAYESMDTSIKSGWYQTRESRAMQIDDIRRQEYLRNWLARIVPLGYRDAESSENLVEPLKKLLPADYIPSTITVNGQKLKRVLPEARLVDEFELGGHGKTWGAKGVLWSPFEAIDPVYARGVAVRVGDMAVGEPGYLSLNMIGRVYGKLQHIAGEVQVWGLEPDLQLDRQWFYPTPATDEFSEGLRKKITEFESRLQKKATVMQKFRLLKKDVEAVSTHAPIDPQVAPILKLSERVKELVEQAKDAGIHVRIKDDDTLVVPKGESRLTIGRNFGAQLLRVKLGRRVVAFDVSETGEPLTTKQLVDCLLDSDRTKVVITGPHVLISLDDSAIANLRLLAALKESMTTRHLTREQVESLLDDLTLTYR
jgi:hypothetical protein